jgi:hypothetical protein
VWGCRGIKMEKVMWSELESPHVKHGPGEEARVTVVIDGNDNA